MGDKGDFFSWLDEAKEASITFKEDGAEKTKTGKPEEILEILKKVGWGNVVDIKRVAK